MNPVPTGIDHVHVEVADKATAISWYERVLGLTPHPEFAVWAEDPSGPTILVSEQGEPTLSLFQRDPVPHSRDATIAFRIGRAGFDAFLRKLEGLGLRDRNGDPVRAGAVVDHDLSLSLYFCDPDGNRLELTTYEVDGASA